MISAESEINCPLLRPHTVRNGETEHQSLHETVEGKKDERIKACNRPNAAKVSSAAAWQTQRLPAFEAKDRESLFSACSFPKEHSHEKTLLPLIHCWYNERQLLF